VDDHRQRHDQDGKRRERPIEDSSLVGGARPSQREQPVRPPSPASEAGVIPDRRQIGDERQREEDDRRREVGNDGDHVPEDRGLDLRPGEQLPEPLRPAEMDDREQRADEDRGQRRRFGDPAHGTAPRRVRQPQDG
jgi:hypothetical protein